MTVKATEDLLYVVKVVLLNIVREIVKDGFQVSDLGAFLKSNEFEAALKTAMADVSQVPIELATLGLMDDLSLARYVYNMSSDVVQELKAYKKPA